MAADDILELLAARHALASTPEPWLDAARGSISIEEAARRVSGQEDPELVERSRQLFAAGDPAVDEARLERLLDACLPPPRRAWRGPLVLGLALAAAVVLAVSLSEDDRTAPPDAVPQLARYELELGQGASSQRAAEPAGSEAKRFYADRPFQATLRPWTEVRTEVEVAVYACEVDGVRRLPLEPRVKANGIVEMESDVADLGLDVGAWELVFVVGAVGSLPRPQTCEDEALAAGDGFQVLRTSIEILPPTSLSTDGVAPRAWVWCSRASPCSAAAASGPSSNASPRRSRSRRSRSRRSWSSTEVVWPSSEQAPLCVLEGDRLELWVEDPEAERVEVWLDDERVEPERHRRDELVGLGLRVDVPATASRVSVVLSRDRDRRAEWSLRLSHGEPTPEIGEVQSAIAADIVAGKIPRALEWLAELRAKAPSSTETLNTALSTAHWLTQVADDPERAESLLREYEELARQSPQGRADLASTWGLVHWKLGRLDEAAIAYREVTRYALQTRDATRELGAVSMYAELLVELGYLDAASHWARHTRALLDDPAVFPADVASTSRTLGWIALSLRAAGRDELDPAKPLRDALRLFGPGGAAKAPGKLGGVRLSLARAALDDGDAVAALAQLDRIDPARVTPDEHLHALEIKIRALLQQGAGATVVGPVLDELRVIADDVNTPQARWQLAVLRGRLAERDGGTQAAIEHYRGAESLYDDVSQLAVFGAGRSTNGALGPEATQRLVSLLVAQGRRPEALCAARLSRARALRALLLPASLDSTKRAEREAQAREYLALKLEIDELEADRADATGQEQQRIGKRVQAKRHEQQRVANELFLARGQLAAPPTCEELSARAPGELLLALYPVGDDWILLAQDDLGISAHRVPVSGALSSRSPAEQSALLLAPVREPLDRAERVRVLAAGDAIEIDVHALPLDGAPLVARMPVSYGAELPSGSSPPLDGLPTALLLADATGSLRASLPEIEAAGQSLRHAGWSTLIPADPDSLPKIRGDLARADLFHHAGHADAATRQDAVGLWPPYADGASGWPSYLELAPPARLDVHDILMLPRSPRWVVLAGCRTGVLDVQHAGTSLALAFLARGSEQVLASPDATDDLLMGEIGQHLYEGITPGEPLDLAVQLQRVLRERAVAGKPIGRARVWVR